MSRLLASGVPAAAPDPEPAASTPSPAADDQGSAPVERLIVGYKSQAAESRSNTEAAKGAKAKGRKAGESLDFDRRLGTGAALVDLGGKLDQRDTADIIDVITWASGGGSVRACRTTPPPPTSST